MRLYVGVFALLRSVLLANEYSVWQRVRSAFAFFALNGERTQEREKKCSTCLSLLELSHLVHGCCTLLGSLKNYECALNLQFFSVVLALSLVPTVGAISYHNRPHGCHTFTAMPVVDIAGGVVRAIVVVAAIKSVHFYVSHIDGVAVWTNAYCGRGTLIKFYSITAWLNNHAHKLYNMLLISEANDGVRNQKRWVIGIGKKSKYKLWWRLYLYVCAFYSCLCC